MINLIAQIEAKSVAPEAKSVAIEVKSVATETTSIGEQITDSLHRSVTGMWTSAIDYLPNVIGMLLVLLIGWIIARVLERLAAMVLTRIRFDTLCEKTGLLDSIQQLGVKASPSRMLGRIVFYILMLMFLITATDVLGMESISSMIRSFMGYIPNLIGALVIIMFGLTLANFVRSLVQNACERVGLDYANAAGKMVYGILLIVVGSLAVGQLQIETQLINKVIEIALLATGAGLAIALGFGTRDMARNIVAGVYARETFATGARLVVGEDKGTLTSIRAVNTELSTPDGKSVFVPNGQLMEMLVRKEKS
ncbi:MAG: mechanosensitive ion channel [Planctomycetota bacterium]|nr:mechanosensitive ion channel [Planctomycetota bacterium]